MADPRRYLLAVGIAKYREWPELSGVPQELERVVNLLTNPRFGFERILQQASDAPDSEDLLTQLAKWANSSERLPTDQLVIYWSGHGEEYREKLHLILSNSGSNPLTKTILFEQLVEGALAEQLGSRGIFVLLDVCYSGHGGIDVGERLGALIRASSVANVPEIAILSASRPRERASQNAFSEAFAGAIEQCERDAQEHEPQLYLDKVMDHVVTALKGKQTPVLAGQWSRMRVFPNPKYDPKRWGDSVSAAVADPDGAEVLRVVVIAREQGSKKLVDTVKSALNQSRDEFKKSFGKSIADPPLVQVLDTGQIFDHEVQLRDSLRALCRADAVIADVTKDGQNLYEPGLMLLLGVRSVARRGITICSVDAKLGDLYKYDLPYNLTFLSLSSHADPWGSSSPELSKKLVNGFDQYARNPTYLDLPPYDMIRNLGSALDDYVPIDFCKGPLYLGPFDREFENECFQPIARELINALRPVARKRLGRNYTSDDEPTIRRLLDRSACQLVAQSLYDAIRRYNFCAVDWSSLRANVFFELGVRLAVGEEGAVHIVARGRPFDGRLKQVEHLSRLFEPIVYDHDDFNEISRSAKEILKRREERSAKLLHVRLYREIAEAVEPEAHEAVVKLQEDLSARAKLSYFLDDEDQRRTTVLHADRNQDVQRAAISTSIGLTLCALMLRYGLESDHAEQDRIDLTIALVKAAAHVEELAKFSGNERDVKALNRICALLKIALNG